MTEDYILEDADKRRLAVAEITAGLQGPKEDRWYWRGKAEVRIAALEEDGKAYGLLPHEEAELATLRSLVEPA